MERFFEESRKLFTDEAELWRGRVSDGLRQSLTEGEKLAAQGLELFGTLARHGLDLAEKQARLVREAFATRTAA